MTVLILLLIILLLFILFANNIERFKKSLSIGNSTLEETNDDPCAVRNACGNIEVTPKGLEITHGKSYDLNWQTEGGKGLSISDKEFTY